MNYNETDVDCGGSLCPPCELGDVSTHTAATSCICSFQKIRPRNSEGLSVVYTHTGNTILIMVHNFRHFSTLQEWSTHSTLYKLFKCVLFPSSPVLHNLRGLWVSISVFGCVRPPFSAGLPLWYQEHQHMW